MFPTDLSLHRPFNASVSYIFVIMCWKNSNWPSDIRGRPTSKPPGPRAFEPPGGSADTSSSPHHRVNWTVCSESDLCLWASLVNVLPKATCYGPWPVISMSDWQMPRDSLFSSGSNSVTQIER